MTGTTPPEPTRVALPAITLSVHDVGDGPAVLLLHGFPDRATLWSVQIARLADAGYRVIAPDLRGFGDSDRPDDVEAYRLRHSVADMVALLGALEIERVVVVGHDYGAAVGWALAMRSASVRGYVALSVGHPNAFRAAGLAQRALSWYMLWFLHPGAAEAVLPADGWAFYRRWAHPGTEDDDLVETQIRDLSRPGALTAGLSWYRANVDPTTFVDEHPVELPPVTCPVLGLIGEDDVALTEAQMAGSAAFVSGPFECVTLPGAGHWLPARHADAVDEHLLAFLDRLD
ncbi:alpha/beta fold hydrolase [Actinomycetospora sp. TBRC 11914]|uniref:alpha/beta fold hydrolase n=1 Tax=Actinomycetospora sp. TBRC 11914 TaxID=2729387 RepID=UPI00145E0AD7|nr:alpha/beta fold hydrolase [Actinomycetospora sp. TBRC 11914]NMO93156.1 alpha/beta fold hydrolase [Actinomycetospora sp. TBRC 11914]